MTSSHTIGYSFAYFAFIRKSPYLRYATGGFTYFLLFESYQSDDLETSGKQA